jgi:hypothetical protein
MRRGEDLFEWAVETGRFSPERVEHYKTLVAHGEMLPSEITAMIPSPLGPVSETYDAVYGKSGTDEAALTRCAENYAAGQPVAMPNGQLMPGGMYRRPLPGWYRDGQ